METLYDVAAQPHYHAWTLREIILKTWPDGHMKVMAYLPERKPYRVRQTAQYQLPRYDANLSYGSKGGTVLACDGGDGCPFYCAPEIE